MFETLKGNEKIKVLLRRVVADGRVPQALILSGPDGIGKKSFALEVARSFTCSDLNSGLPCEKCPACIRSLQFKLPTSGKKADYLEVYFSGHPDIGMVVPNKNTIYIDAIRNLAEEANYRPFEGRARVFIIDQAEKLGLSQKNAANALLKTLEEPAPNTYIILVTSKPSTILQTIHSRCQTVRFSPVPADAIEKHLVENKEISSSDARLIAKAAKGSVSRALNLDPEEYRALRTRLLEALSAATSGRGMAAALKVSNEISTLKGPEDFSSALELLESIVRDVLLLQRGQMDKLSHPDLTAELSVLSNSVSKDGPVTWIENIESLKSGLRFNINKKVGADALFVKMAGM